MVLGLSSSQGQDGLTSLRDAADTARVPRHLGRVHWVPTGPLTEAEFVVHPISFKVLLKTLLKSLHLHFSYCVICYLPGAVYTQGSDHLFIEAGSNYILLSRSFIQICSFFKPQH